MKALVAGIFVIVRLLAGAHVGRDRPERQPPHRWSTDMQLASLANGPVLT